MPLNEERLLLDGDGHPRDPVCGFETEYAIHCEINGRRAENYYTFLATNMACNLAPDQFEEDGSRQYIDINYHPEYSSAEDIVYLDAAYRTLRGHAITERNYSGIAGRLSEEFRGLEVVLRANTCDDVGNSWSSHGNILASRSLHPTDYIDALATHNLSRIVWSGAGLVAPDRSKQGVYKFYLSEKAEHIWQIASISTTHARPLVNLRDEPLASGEIYRRVHDIAGETVFSPNVNALRLATTAIILAACARGVNFDNLQLEDPVHAIREISHDPTLKRLVYMADGKKYTGIDIQRLMAQTAIGDGSYLTQQQTYWSEKWLALLDDLENDPELCGRQVDWVVKKRLIEKQLEAKHQAGSSHSDLKIAWSRAMEYHGLLPKEGTGMRLLRSGFFENSPTNEQLDDDDGLALPPTRAALRGNAIARLRRMHAGFVVDWYWLKRSDVIRATAELSDPFSTTDETLEKLLAA